jgi:hypothetical protein
VAFTLTGMAREDDRSATVDVNDSRLPVRLAGDALIVSDVTAAAASGAQVAATPTGPFFKVSLSDPQSVMLAVASHLRPGYAISGDAPLLERTREPRGAVE